MSIYRWLICSSTTGTSLSVFMGDRLLVGQQSLFFHQLLERGWLKERIALDRQAQPTADRLELGQGKRAKFPLNANHVAPKDVLAVKLHGVPRPARIRRKKLHLRDFLLKGTSSVEY